MWMHLYLPAGRAKPRPVIKAFDKELTDTSRKAVNEFRK